MVWSRRSTSRRQRVVVRCTSSSRSVRRVSSSSSSRMPVSGVRRTCEAWWKKSRSRDSDFCSRRELAHSDSEIDTTSGMRERGGSMSKRPRPSAAAESARPRNGRESAVASASPMTPASTTSPASSATAGRGPVRDPVRDARVLHQGDGGVADGGAARTSGAVGSRRSRRR